MKLQHSVVTKINDHLRVEILFADAPDIDEATAKILIDIPIEIQGQFQQLVETEIEALRIARDVIGQAYTEKKQIVNRYS